MRGRPVRQKHQGSYFSRNQGSSGISRTARSYPLGSVSDYKDDIGLTDNIRGVDVDISADGNHSEENMRPGRGITVDRSVHIGSQPAQVEHV